MTQEEKWREAERLTREYSAAIRDLGPSFSSTAAIADTEQQLVSARATQIQSFEDFQQMIYTQLRMLMDMTEITPEAVSSFLHDMADTISAQPAKDAEPAPPLDELVLQFSADIQKMGPQYSGVLAVAADREFTDPSLVSASLNLAHPDVLRQLISGIIGTAAAGNHWDREELIHFLADVRYMVAKWLNTNLDGTQES